MSKQKKKARTEWRMMSSETGNPATLKDVLLSFAKQFHHLRHHPSTISLEVYDSARFSLLNKCVFVCLWPLCWCKAWRVRKTVPPSPVEIPLSSTISWKETSAWINTHLSFLLCARILTNIRQLSGCHFLFPSSSNRSSGSFEVAGKGGSCLWSRIACV